MFARYRIGPKMYRSALAVSNDAGTACRWVRTQVVIRKAVLWHSHSEPSTALSIDSKRVRTTATPRAAIASIASAFRFGGKKVMTSCSAALGARTLGLAPVPLCEGNHNLGGKSLGGPA